MKIGRPFSKTAAEIQALVLQVKTGKTIKQVAAEQGLSTKTISRWCHGALTGVIRDSVKRAKTVKPIVPPPPRAERPLAQIPNGAIDRDRYFTYDEALLFHSQRFVELAARAQILIRRRDAHCWCSAQ